MVGSLPALVALAAMPLRAPAEPAEPTPIVGGQEVQLGQWDAVVGYQVGVRFCSGTIVGPRLILTAAHCLAGLEERDLASFAVALGVDARQPEAVAGVNAFGEFPEYCGECFNDRRDIGYLLLREEISLPSFPRVITDQSTWDATMGNGDEVTLIGFGQIEDGEVTPQCDKGIGLKREVVSTIGPHSESGLDFRAGGDGRGTCNGDSGGPAMVDLPDGEVAVAGILSGGFGECGEGGVFDVPLAALAWIRDETGIDLLPTDCDGPDCIDTAREIDGGGGCGCRSEPGPAPWAALFAVAWLARRRRRRALP